MTVEKKDSKKPNREEFLKQAQELGIDTKDLTDEQLLFKVITELNKTSSQLAASMSSNDTRTLKKYLSGIETNVTDEDFLFRMMNLNIPSYYLHLFNNDDAAKKDKDLWAVVNKSGINPFSSLKELLDSNKSFVRPN